jgi:amino acid transporter
MDYFTAINGHDEVMNQLAVGTRFDKLDENLVDAYHAYENSPVIFGFHLVLDLPALAIIVLITALVYRGIKESRNASNAMVIVKLAVILLVLCVGIFYIDVDNWSPFAPNGFSGILKGVSSVFFAYIGFDAISTTAEECENPQRDLPRGMMWAIIICTILYIAIALVITGIVSYNQLNVGDPLAFVFDEIDLKMLSGIIAVSAVVAMASVLLVFQMGQPRIWMSMSRDGLLPAKFSKVHPKYKTPSFATIVVGFVVAIPALFMNLTMVTDLCSIGTLFAFVLVCGGVLMLQHRTDIPRGKFRTPYINSKYVMPVLLLVAVYFAATTYWQDFSDFVVNRETLKKQEEIIGNLNPNQKQRLENELLLNDRKVFVALDTSVEKYYEAAGTQRLMDDAKPLNLPKSHFYSYGWSHFVAKLPGWFFILFSLVLTVLCVIKNLSLIPVLGLLSCLYMMTTLNIMNWFYFLIWLLIGLVIYFGYGRKNSKLARSLEENNL